MFNWAEECHDWYINWPHPVFPSVGDTFAFCEFVDHEIIENFTNVYFIGKGKYSGLEVSILGMLENDYSTKIANINWMPKSVEIELITDIYDNEDGYPLWEKKEMKI